MLLDPVPYIWGEQKGTMILTTCHMPALLFSCRLLLPDLIAKSRLVVALMLLLGSASHPPVGSVASLLHSRAECLHVLAQRAIMGLSHLP